MTIGWQVVTAIVAIAAPSVHGGVIGLILSILNYTAGLAPYILADHIRNRRRGVESLQLR
jgi:hypothetical protein